MNRNMFDSVKITVLTKEKKDRIHSTSLSILEDIGVIVEDKETIDLLDGLGACVEPKGIVKIPSNLVEEAIKSAPDRVLLYDRNGNVSMTLEGENTYFGCSADCLKYLDPYSGDAVPFTSAHAEKMAKVGDYCSNISFINPLGMLSDYDPRIGSQISFEKVLVNTSKTINFCCNEAQSCADIIEMASLVVGGYQELSKKPFVFHYCEPIPPLTHGKDSCQKIMMCAETGVPVVYNPYCMMGGTAPCTLAGALAQSFAEILAGLVIHQGTKKGAPFIMGNMPTTIDMRTTIGTYGTPEFYLGVAAASEMAQYYGLPFYGTAGTTDAKIMDHQAVMEATMNCLVNYLSWPNVVHDIGIMYHCSILSPELVVLTNELISMIKVLREGIIVNDETLAFETIKAVGQGGHYLDSDHTLRHFKEIWYSNIFDRSMSSDKTISVNEKINDLTKTIISEHQPERLDRDILKEISDLEMKWMANLKLINNKSKVLER